MGKLSSWLLGIGLSAGAVYYLDPNRGEQRRVQLKERMSRLQADAERGYDEGMRDLRNRARGLLAEGMARLDEGETPDWLVEERLRSRLRNLTRYPSLLDVSVRDGVATLTGQALSEDSERLLASASAGLGVKSLRNNLQLRDTADEMPQGIQPVQRMDGAANWTPAGRLLGVFGAGSLMLYSLTRHGLLRTAFSWAGLALAFRALTNKPIKQLIGMSGQTGGAIQVNKTIEVNAPVGEVYDLWSNFENFPRFMANVKEVRRDGDRSHWVVSGPAGVPVEFDGITTQNVPNELIAWETLPDSTVKHAGVVRFKQAGEGRTQINVRMTYTPPAGIIGHGVAAVFGADPRSSMDEDMARLKTLLEEGKTSAKGRRVKKEDVIQ